jgi:UDP-glucose 4-epimerase
LSRILVTGGSGFIGSHVVDSLLDAGHRVVNYDLRPSPYHENGEVETVIGDLDDTEALGKALRGCEAAVHLAACADVGIVLEDPAAAERANSRGTLSVLEACRAEGVTRVIYGSTIWVYDGSADDPVTEESTLNLPKHLYTASKLAGEMYCTSYGELYGLEPTILRFGIPYGPRARPATVIAIFIDKALRGEPLTLAGDGMQTRRFVYVKDLADGVARALAPEAANRVYNLAGTETVTIRELAEIIRDEVGPVEIVHTPGRSGDFSGAEISSVRASEELDWAASTPIRKGVSLYRDWVEHGQPKPLPVAAAQESPAESVVGVAMGGLCALLGTAISYLLAARLGLHGGQLHAVAMTTLAASLIAMSLSPVSPLRGRDLTGAVLVAALYVVLLAIPESRHGLTLGAPHLDAVLLSALGTAIAMSAFTGARRWRASGESDAAPERA